MIRFVILSHNRSGSHFLERYLNSHQDIRCTGELFWTGDPDYGYISYKNRMFLNRLQHFFFLKHLISKFLDEFYEKYIDAKAVGFLLKYSQANRSSGIRGILKKKNIKVIHLMRRNFVIRNLACEVRRQGLLPGKIIDMNNFDQKIVKSRIHIDPPSFLLKLNANKAVVEKFKKRFCDIESGYLELYYDSFFSDFLNETKRILQFLGLNPDVNLSTDLVRIEPDTAAEMIDNIEEVRKALAQTDYYNFLINPEKCE